MNLLTQRRRSIAYALHSYRSRFRVGDLKLFALSLAAAATIAATARAERSVFIDRHEMKLALVRPGRFLMGSSAHRGQQTLRQVTISRRFWMGTYPVTQREYEALMGYNPSYWRGPERPVDNVNWMDAMLFCERLTEQERAAGRLPQGYVFRLPTEAEWEFAARGGVLARNTIYPGSDELDKVAHRGYETENVGSKAPNELGLYDLAGNVDEWCYDWSGPHTADMAAVDPVGPETGRFRVFRGGAYKMMDLGWFRVDSTSSRPPDFRDASIGFRVVLAPSLPQRP